LYGLRRWEWLQNKYQTVQTQINPIGAWRHYQLHRIAKRTYNRYDILDRFRKPVASREIIEFPCMALKKSGNGLDGGMVLELLGEWVFGQ